MDSMNRNPGVPEPEGAPTTKLLKKKPERIEFESSVTTPLTSRLADLAVEDEEKKKSNVGVIVGGILAGVVVIAVVVYFLFFSSGNSGIFSGGSAGIAAGGTDSMDAQIVQGRASVPAANDRQAAASAQPVGGSAPTSSAGDRRDEPASTRDAGRTATPAAPVVQASRIESSSSISSGSEAAPTLAARPTPSQPAPSQPAPSQPAPTAPTPAPASATPTPAAPVVSSSIEQGFTLSEQPKVKEGDLVPLTDDVIKPEIIKRSTPSMPSLARQLRKSGQVIVRVLVDETGSVADAKLVNETPKGFGFGKAATDAAMEFKYKPARKGNVRVKVWDTIFFTFR